MFLECRYPTYVCSQILAGIIDKSDENDEMWRDTIAVSKICSSKFWIFMVHQMRYTKQNDAIDKIREEMAKISLNQMEGMFVL